MESDKHFQGSIPRFYETYMVPLIFEPFAAGMAARVAAKAPRRVLEIAAGTGVVTRHLASMLPEATEIIATDLNQPMLDHAASIGTARPVEWRQVDAMHLPFADGSFDVVVCQFAFMFFPDKPLAASEARRVLRPGGTYLFSVWDRIEDNEFADVITSALVELFPETPPRFLARTPHGHFDAERIAQDVAAGGFTAPPRIDTVTERSRAASPDVPVLAYLEGTPLRNEIDPSRRAEAMEIATRAMARSFGNGPVDGRIQAHIIEVTR